MMIVMEACKKSQIDANKSLLILRGSFTMMLILRNGPPSENDEHVM